MIQYEINGKKYEEKNEREILASCLLELAGCNREIVQVVKELAVFQKDIRLDSESNATTSRGEEERHS